MIQDKCITVKTEQEKLFSLFVYNSVTSSSHKPWMNILKNSTAYQRFENNIQETGKVIQLGQSPFDNVRLNLAPASIVEELLGFELPLLEKEGA